jgi:hypothetical protein
MSAVGTALTLNTRRASKMKYHLAFTDHVMIDKNNQQAAVDAIYDEVANTFCGTGAFRCVFYPSGITDENPRLDGFNVRVMFRNKEDAQAARWLLFDIRNKESQ